MGRKFIVFKIIRAPRVQYRLSERAEVLSELHNFVQVVFHRVGSWICQNGPVTQSAWAKFCTTLNPSHYLASVKQAGDFLNQTLWHLPRSTGHTQNVDAPQRLGRQFRTYERVNRTMLPGRPRLSTGVPAVRNKCSA